MLDKNSIIAAQDFKYKDIEVAEWGGSVRLRGLSSKDRDEYESSIGITQDMSNMRARLVVRSLVDKEGERIFLDNDADALGEKNAETIARLFDEVRDLSGMSDEALGIAEGN